MNKDALLFVYGTLLPGERMDLQAGRLSYDVCLLGSDEINGKLYTLGPYPGVKLIGAPDEDFNPNFSTVKGAVFKLNNSSIGAVLDAYESYRADDPEHGLYNRCQVFTRHGRYVWVYTYNGPVTEDQLIKTGDWQNQRFSYNRRPPSYGMRSGG